MVNGSRQNKKSNVKNEMRNEFELPTMFLYTARFSYFHSMIVTIALLNIGAGCDGYLGATANKVKGLGFRV